MTRSSPHLRYERALWRSGCRLVAGFDEAGRGALAGPVVASAVILPPQRRRLGSQLAGIRDSKQLSPSARQYWQPRIERAALSVGIGIASAAEVDGMGIVSATRRAMSRALQALSHPPQHLLLDYMLLPEEWLPQTSFTRGDSRVLSIAAASVIAKVTRDRLLAELDEAYPGYGFKQNKGYGTAQHRASLRTLGPTPIHRRSFSPVASCAATAE